MFLIVKDVKSVYWAPAMRKIWEELNKLEKQKKNVSFQGFSFKKSRIKPAAISSISQS